MTWGSNYHYRMHAYVCGQGCVRHLEDPRPTLTFTQIYQQRPNDCQYAVAEECDYSRFRNRFIVWDLLGVSKFPNNQLRTPPPRFVHDNLNAAILATVLLYGQGDGK